MSLSEIAQIMKEAGLTSSSTGGVRGTGGGSGDGSGDGKILVEHVFVFDVSEKWEKTVRGVALGCLELGRHAVDSLRLVAVAGSIALLLWGASRIVVVAGSARRRPTPPRLDRDGGGGGGSATITP